MFSVRERYRRDHFEPWYKGWVDTFVKYARKRMEAYSDERLIDMLRSHEELMEEEGFGDRGFLKAAVFRMLRRHCEAGYEEALDHLRGWMYPTDETVATAGARRAECANPAVAAEPAQPVATPPNPGAEAPCLVTQAAPVPATPVPPAEPAPILFKAVETPDDPAETIKPLSADLARLDAESQEANERLEDEC